MIKDFLRRFFIEELDDAYNAGYDFGNKRGHETGYAIGKNTGKSLGCAEGYGRGYQEGHQDGRREGYISALIEHDPDNYEAIGWAKGYDEGFQAGLGAEPIYGDLQGENIAYVSGRVTPVDIVNLCDEVEVEASGDKRCETFIDNQSFCKGAHEMARMVREILGSAGIDDQRVLISISIAEEGLCAFLGETID